MSNNPFADDPIDDNPYQPPIAEAQVVGILSNRREDLRAVATYQRGIIVCILIYLIFVCLQFGIPPEFRFVLGLVLLPLGIVGTVLVFLLSTKVYGVGIGIGLGILTLIPCIGLIVLLMINGKATAILRQNGIRVGLMGADMSQL